MLLRPAEPDDAMAVARVHVRSWQAAYRTLMPGDYLDQLRPEDRAPQYNFRSVDRLQPWTIVAAEAGMIHGFATTAPAREPDLPGHGELCALYVDPDWFGRGIGIALVSAARARLFDLGFRNALLWVLAGRSCGALLPDRSVGSRWRAPNRHGMGCKGRRNPLPARP